MDNQELKQIWMSGAKDMAMTMATLLRQEYRIHEGQWWLVSSGKLQRPLTLDEVIWNAKQDGLLPDRLYIIGGTAAEARGFAILRQIPREKVTLVSGSRAVHWFKGTTKATVVLCERYYEAIDSESIAYLQNQRMAVIYRAG